MAKKETEKKDAVVLNETQLTEWKKYRERLLTELEPSVKAMIDMSGKDGESVLRLAMLGLARTVDQKHGEAASKIDAFTNERTYSLSELMASMRKPSKLMNIAEAIMKIGELIAKHTGTDYYQDAQKIAKTALKTMDLEKIQAAYEQIEQLGE